MNSPSTQRPTSSRRPQHRFRTRYPRVNAALNALLWLIAIVLAIVPVPW